MLGCHALLWGKKDGHTGAHALQRTRVVASEPDHVARGHCRLERLPE